MTKEIVLKMEPEDDGFPFSDRYHKLLFDLRVNEWQYFIEIAINAAIRWWQENRAKVPDMVLSFAVAPDGVVIVHGWFGVTNGTVVVPWAELREFVGAPPGSPKS